MAEKKDAHDEKLIEELYERLWWYTHEATDEEYDDACELFRALGLGGFFQQAEAVSESFIPAFDGTGLEESET